MVFPVIRATGIHSVPDSLESPGIDVLSETLSAYTSLEWDRPDERF